MKKTISLPQRYVEQLEDEKERTGAPMSEIIRRALDDYFSSDRLLPGMKQQPGNGHPDYNRPLKDII